MSSWLTRTASLLAGIVALLAVAPGTARQLGELLAVSLRGADAAAEPLAVAGAAGRVWFGAAGAVAVAAALGAVAAGGMQTGFVFAPGRIAPDASRLKPGQTWASKLKLDALINGLIALIAATLGGVTAAVGIVQLVRSSRQLVPAASDGSTLAAAGVVADAVAVVVASWVGIACLVAGVDAVWQHAAFRRRHRMSPQEIRDEYKQSEGDPQHKARRARSHRELLAGDLRSGVGRADVVVTNPTHVAVGLRYRPDEVDAPVVTVSGRGDRAAAIKREARRRGVLEYADPPSARAMVELEVGDEVPERLFEPIAVIFRWVEHERRRVRR